ncbi:hypothetical protein ILUMI_18235 [Ignelater luminosus]|uniref:Uncharacterized protein n=1 Tax=Ignelater luminosus TaxID=2038154 RepID=A0A8K0G737_IGNLU|nr:hypothetical protein ILUMI_18235 [Ignelater luminosus]
MESIQWEHNSRRQDQPSSRKLCESQLKKKDGKQLSNVLLLHDNALVHMSAKAQAAVYECSFLQFNHPPYMGFAVAGSPKLPYIHFIAQ